MIVVDTNVVSEVLRPVPETAVVEWMKALEPATVFSTSVSEAEIFTGLFLLPVGKRRTGLLRMAERIFELRFAERVLPFDSAASRAYAEIQAERARLGRPISYADAQIAAIVRTHGATLATRNTRDFAHCGIALVNPWNA